MLKKSEMCQIVGTGHEDVYLILRLTCNDIDGAFLAREFYLKFKVEKSDASLFSNNPLKPCTIFNNYPLYLAVNN